MKFNHLNVPTNWQNYWSRYPEGHTILEALISWVSQVDSMVDNVNNWNEYLDSFVATFDKELQQTVTGTLSDWQDSGFLDVVISEALQWQLTDYITTNEADKASLTAELQQTNDHLIAGLGQKASIASVAEKIGGEVKAEPENLSATVLGMIDGSGGPYNLLSIPQDKSVSAAKTTAEFTFKGELNASRDLNDPLETGLYFISGDSVPLNAPLPNASAILYHNSFGGGYAEQIYAGFNKSFAGQDFRYSRTSYYSAPQANSTWREERSVLPENLTKEFMYHGILGTSTDLNNVTSLKTGFYLMQNQNLPTNAPLADTSLYFHYRFNGTFTMQMVVGYNDPNKRYIRQLEDGQTPKWVDMGTSQSTANKKLAGKHVLFMGDSKVDPTGALYDYTLKFAELTGCERTNVGYAGAKMAMVADHEPYNSHSLYHLSTTLDFTSYDIVTIDYLTNDHMWGLPLGDKQADEFTVGGSLYKSLTNIFTSNPNIQVFLFMPPTPYTSDGSQFYDYKTNPTLNGERYHYDDLYNTVNTIANEFGVPVLDTWNLAQVNKINYTEKYEDGIHPNVAFKRDELAPMYANFVTSYF